MTDGHIRRACRIFLTAHELRSTPYTVRTAIQQRRSSSSSSSSSSAMVVQGVENAADEAAELESLVNAVSALAPPKPLPEGWVVKESRSQPGYRYFFNHLTGECTWYPPYTDNDNNNEGEIHHNSGEGENQQATMMMMMMMAAAGPDDEYRFKATRKRGLDHAANTNNSGGSEKPSLRLSDKNTTDGMATTTMTTTTTLPVLAVVGTATGGDDDDDDEPTKTTTDNNNNNNKKRHHNNHINSNSNNKRVKPDQVRVLHILKKHKGARRPSSWRVPTITISKDEAIAELQSLLELLHEVAADPKELRATMEELARTESDCSSAKRGGDLGFFGPKKMQPAFEEASFQLDVGQLSDIVDTSSGVHVILRIG